MGKGRQYLNENICLQRIEKHGIRTNKYLMYDIKILCKKYKGMEGVVEKCKSYLTNYDSELHDKRIKTLVDYCNDPNNKYDREIYVAPPVDITKSEIEKIKSLKNDNGADSIEAQKLAFMLLVLAKIKDKDSDGKYYVYGNGFDYQELSGLTKRGKKIDVLMNKLHDNGLIHIGFIPHRRNLLKIEIKFIGEDIEDIELSLNETDYLYPKYIYSERVAEKKTRYVQCEICGLKVAASGNRLKYCEDCKKEIRLQQERERIRKMRNGDKVNCTQLENAQEAI